MEKQELRGMDYLSLSRREREDQAFEWKGRHLKLVYALGIVGTEVLRQRSLVIDLDRHPYHFTAGEVREFIFPAQKGKKLQDNDVEDETTNRYDEMMKADYDETKVRGHLRVEYDDVNPMPTLRLVDLRGESELPDEVLSIICDTFTEPMPQELQDVGRT